MKWFSGGSTTPPPPWLLSYFEHLKADFGRIVVDEAAITALAEKPPAEVSEGQIYQLAQYRLSKHSLNELLAEAPLLRVKFQQTAGAHQFQAYKPADLSKQTGDDAQRAALLADLSTIVSALHLHYSLQRHIDELQRRISISVLRLIVGYTVLWGLLLLIGRELLHSPLVSVVLTVTFVGITTSV
jgi:hypothetical protein